MLKILAIFALALLVLPVKTYSQTYKAQDASEGSKPTPSTPKVAPQQSSSAAVQKESQKQVPYDIRIISTPHKDAYDYVSLSLSVALALVGIVGIVVAICTLRKIERQTKATEDAVSAARDSYSLAESTAKRQLRAYFGAAEGKLYIRRDGSVEPRVTLTNFGQTPAYGLQVIESGRFETRPFKKIPPPDQGRLPLHAHIIGGGQPYHFTCRPVTYGKGEESLLSDLSSTRYAFILNCWCTYTDIFNDAHHVDFQLIVGGGTPLQKTIDQTGEWLGFFTASEGNSSE